MSRAGDQQGVSPSRDAAGLVAEGMMTVREVAEFLRVGRSTVYVWMDRGDLCFCKLGRSRRIPRRAVLELAAEHLRGGVRCKAGRLPRGEG